MSKGFYWKLAASNFKKNRKNCIPYMLTCIITIAMFYMILSLSSNPGILEVTGGEIVQLTMRLGCIVTGIFAVIFLFYTNSFLMKRRKKEFGLFNILGMEKRHLSKMIACETLYMFLLSLILGLGIGILGDKLMFLILLKLFNGTVTLGFQLEAGVIVPVVLFFGAIFLLIFLNSMKQIHLTNPIELLHGSEMGEREPKTKWMMTLIGFLSLGGGYYIALTTKSPIEAILMFFVAVILVIIGTYCLFTSGSIAVLKTLRKNKRYYYKPRHFIAVSGMIYRMKQNAVGLANICILSTMVLVMISSTMSMYIGGQDLIYKRYPREIVVSAEEDPSEMIEDAMEAEGISIENPIKYRYLNYAAYRSGNRFLTGVEEDVDWSLLYSILILTVEDYNAISHNSYELGDHEVLIARDRMDAFGDTVYLAGEEYRVQSWISEFPYNGEIYALATGTYVVIVPDEETLLKLEQAQRESYQDDASSIHYFYGMDLAQRREDVLPIVLQALKGNFSYTVESRAEGEESFMGMYGGLFFIGVFLGVLFIMATILIIYYKQISEGYDDRSRFEIMQKVGMSRSEVKRAIHSQVLTVFFLPLIAAGIHISFAFPFITRILAIFSMTDIMLFALCTVGCFLVFGIFYAIVYTMTAKVYYRIVQ